MSIFEYNKEEEERKLRKAEYEAGYDSGKEAGYDLGRKEGIKRLIERMRQTGKYTDEDISEITGISYEEIKSLQQKV